MHTTLLRMLRCPTCGSRYTAAHTEESGGRIEYAILSCACARLPVVAGILIMPQERVGVSPRPVAEVVGMVERGRGREALRQLVMPVAPEGSSLAPAWARWLPRTGPLRRARFAIQRVALDRWRARAARLMLDDGGASACDMLDLHYRRSGTPAPTAYDYFKYRFGQPRHLVALDLASVIREPGRPLLELACGFGHITRALLRRAGGQPVVGVDLSFLALYVARRYIAPEADLICGPADTRLPFEDGAFQAALCSDGFHYFGDKATAVAELLRVCGEDGLVLMAVLRNRLLEYAYAGAPLSPSEYLALFGDVPARAVPDEDLLARYLERRGPALATQPPRERLDAAPTLSIAATRCAELLRDYPDLGAWPHAEGRLRLNPLYHVDPPEGGRATARRSFPSAFYAADHPESARYMPERVTLDAALLADPERGRGAPEVERLVAQCVAIEIPDRYLSRVEEPR